MQETVDGPEAAVHCATEGFTQLRETVDGAKAAVDVPPERVKGAVNAMAEPGPPAAGLLAYGRPRPWLPMGRAVLTA